MANIPNNGRRVIRQRLRTLGREEGERHASWLELFFDLVFVLAVSKVAAVLARESDLIGFAKYIALFIPVWWAWVGFTFHADRFESETPEYRILTFATMLAVASLATTVGGAFTAEGSTAYAVCYALVLLTLVAQYVVTAVLVPLARQLALQYIFGLGISAFIFFFSVLFEPPTRYILWAAAVALTLATPFLNLKLARIIPIDHSHIPERFGLFTIIVLGEAVIAVANGAAGVPWTTVHIAIGSFGFAMAACIWWINFEFVEDDLIKEFDLLPRLVYLYGHFVIVAAIVAVGIGVEHAIKEAAEPHLHTPALMLLGGGVTAYLGVTTVIRIVSNVCTLIWVRLVAISLSIAITGAGFVIPPIATIAGLLAVLIGSVVLEAKYAEEKEDTAETPRLLPCEHDAQAIIYRPRSTEGCEECVKNNYKWVHLRMCLACGHVGCCDSSRNKHATKHYHNEGHAIMASLEDGDHWAWCYPDERFVPLVHRIAEYHPTKIELIEAGEA
jgi:low temperature requirement protein LtrA